MYLGVSVSLSWRLQASVLLRDLCGQCVSECCVRPCVSASGACCWVSVGVCVAVSACVSLCCLRLQCVCLCSQSLCFVAASLSSLCLPTAVSWCLSPCLLQRVSVTGFCGSVYVSDALGLPISVPVCHCVCPPMCHHLPRCPVGFTHHPGHRWACQAHWCPELQPSPSHPRPAMGQAGRLFAMPAPGKHQDPERKGHLPHLRSLPLSLPWTGLAQSPTGGAPKLEMCPDPSPTHGPPPSQAPSLGLCLLASLCQPLAVCWPLCFFLSLLPLTCISLWFILWNDPCLHSVPSTLDFFCLFSGKSDLSPFLICL